MSKIILLVFGICFSLLAAPPKQIPANLFNEYTLGWRIPVYDWYLDNSYPPDQPLIFKIGEIDLLIERAKQHQEGYYGATDSYLYTLLDKYSSFIQEKKIAILGTTVPWYESIILSYGGKPTTIEYNKIVSEDSRIQVMTVKEYENNPLKFDAIVTISSLEHDGLGRYGDPLNPWGDIETMRKIKGMLKEGGLLFLSVPVGQDSLYWNAHRVYGPLRLPLLLEEWETLESCGFSPTDLLTPSYSGHQPVFVLRPKIINHHSDFVEKRNLK